MKAIPITEATFSMRSAPLLLQYLAMHEACLGSYPGHPLAQRPQILGRCWMLRVTACVTRLVVFEHLTWAYHALLRGILGSGAGISSALGLEYVQPSWSLLRRQGPGLKGREVCSRITHTRNTQAPKRSFDVCVFVLGVQKQAQHVVYTSLTTVNYQYQFQVSCRHLMLQLGIRGHNLGYY